MEGTLSNITSILPEMRSLIACALPLYGTCTISVPVIALNGTTGHLGGELFKAMTGTEMVHVPYKGSAQAINDLISGNIEVMFDNVPSIGPHVKSGRVRGLGVSAPKRAAQFPDLPTIAEAGVPGYETNSWGGVIGPGGLFQEVISRLHAEIRKALAAPAVAERYRQLDAEADGGGAGTVLALG